MNIENDKKEILKLIYWSIKHIRDKFCALLEEYHDLKNNELLNIFDEKQ